MNKEDIIKYFDSIASKRDSWRKRNSYYHNEIFRLIKFLIPEGYSVLDIGSSTGELLNKINPTRGVGVDLSSRMIELARKKYPHLDFLVQDAEDLKLNEKFDYVIMSASIGVFSDVWKVLRGLRQVTTDDSRIIIVYYNGLWEPILKIAEKLKLRMPRPYQNWLGIDDIKNLLYLNGYEVVKKDKHLLLPIYIPILSWLINRIFVNFPLVKQICLSEYIVAKKVYLKEQRLSCSVIIPCRNEAGNIEQLLKRMPLVENSTEVIFVDGYSTDGTVEKINEMIIQYKEKFNIKLIHQIPRDDKVKIKNNIIKPDKMLRLGKADAVIKGFDAATGDILVILDADATVPPEDISKFYCALAESKGELINGTRLVYPIEKDAMRLLNLYANEMFGHIFSWLLGQKVKDTLCGTKALTKESYLKIKKNKKYFGDFDPFGDFELLFGAAKQNLMIAELPVRYHARTYGNIKIERFRHGLLLLKMCFIGFLRFKLGITQKNKVYVK